MWSWEADSLGPATSAAILSQHLFLPLAATAGLAFQGPRYVPELNESELGDKIDATAQDYRRLPALKFSQLFRKPRFATSLQRVTAVLNHVEALRSCFPHSCGYLLTQCSVAPILLDFGSEPAAQLPNSNYKSTAPSYETPLLIVCVVYCVDMVSHSLLQQPPLRREPSLPPAIPNSAREPPTPLKAPTPLAVVPKREPSQKIPSPPPTAAPMDVDEALEGDITEADTHSDSASPAQKKSHVQRKAASPSSESPHPPAAKKRKVSKIARNDLDEEDDSQDTKLKPTSKGKQRAPIIQDSESDDSVPAGRGRGRGSATARVKQPLKRGGRRL